MGQFSVEKPVAPGSVLSGNQHCNPLEKITNPDEIGRAELRNWGSRKSPNLPISGEVHSYPSKCID
jgi:hypothetical protein